MFNALLLVQVIFSLPAFGFNPIYYQNKCVTDQQFVVATMIYLPPFFIINRDNKTKQIVSRSGLAIDYLSWIRYLDLINPAEYEKYGLMPFMLKSLLNKDSDIIPLMTIQVERIQYLDYSYPISIANYRLMLPYPSEDQRLHLTAVFQPIHTTGWFMLSLAMIGVLVFLILYHKCFCQHNSFELTITNIITRRTLYVFGIFTGRSAYGKYFVLPYKSFLSIRFIVGLLALMTVILFSSYTTTLISFLTVQKLKPVINSFEELASSKQYKLVEPLQSYMSTLFLNATTEPFKTLGNSLRQNPHLLITNYPESLAEKILEYNGVYAHVEHETRGRIGHDMKTHDGQCRFTSSKPLEYVSMPYFIVLRKGDPLTKTIHLGTIKMLEYGLLEYWYNTYVPNLDKCIIKEKQSFHDELRQWKPLTLKQLSGSFLMLVTGVLFAILFFILELVWNKFWEKV